jgi:hypothetical protein
VWVLLVTGYRFAIQFGGINFVYPEISSSLPAWSFAPVTLSNWVSDKLVSPLLIGGSNVFGLDGFFLNGVTLSSGIPGILSISDGVHGYSCDDPTGSWQNA